MRTKKAKPIVRDIAAEKKQAKIDKVTHKVALVVAFVSVFYFFIKLLFL